MSNSRLGLRSTNGNIRNIVEFSYDSDAENFISTLGITNHTHILAINDLVKELKSSLLWNKLLVIYPFIGGTSLTHSYNLKNTSLNRLRYVGGWTHTSLGAQPNGTNGYAITLFNMNQLETSLSNGMGFYSGSNLQETSSDPINMGIVNNINTTAILLGRQNTVIFSRANGPYISTSNTTMTGMFSTQRVSTTLNIYVNSTSVVSAATSGNLTFNPIFLGTAALTASPYSSGYVRNDFRFAYISEGLGSVEISNLYNIVQNYQTSLSRQA